MFYRKILTLLKIQMHPMLLDTLLNSQATVAGNLFENFTETAMKMHRYISSLSRGKRPRAPMIIQAITGVLRAAGGLTKRERPTKLVSDYSCSVSRKQVLWLVAVAFENVLQSKATAYRQVLRWLKAVKDGFAGSKGNHRGQWGVVEGSSRAFKDHRF